MIKKLVLTLVLCVMCWPVYAVTPVYYSVSPFGTGDIKVACNISISGGAGVATFSVAQTGNIGVGLHVISAGVDGYISVMTNSTTATIVTALGAAHGNVTSEALTSISHEYASLSAFDAGFTDASHINNSSLVAADIQANACCYYDHDDGTADGITIINFGTTDATRYLKIFTPQGGTESINNQRHGGQWDSNKYFLRATNDILVIQEEYTRIEGLQFHLNTSSANKLAVYYFVSGGLSGDQYLNHSIIKANALGTGQDGIRISNGGNTFYISNNIIYDFAGSTGRGIRCEGTTVNIDNNTIYDSNVGVFRSSGTVTVRNTAVLSNVDDFSGTMTISYCASDDGDGTNPQTLNATSNYAAEFTDVTTGDFSLVNGGVCEENGTDLSGSGIDDDIIGTSRPQQTNYDIGAFECSTCTGDAGPSIQLLLLKHIIK